jgi:hypothetical protein
MAEKNPSISIVDVGLLKHGFSAHNIHFLRGAPFNKTFFNTGRHERRHDTASSLVELVLFTMHFNISSSAAFGFDKSKQ